MTIKVYSFAKDKVIKGIFANAETNYDFALKELYPLINKLEEQRDLQRASFYKRLEIDLIKGCIMPAITVAFETKSKNLTSIPKLTAFVKHNIKDAFILDGIQRLNTLNRTFLISKGKLDLKRPMYLNLIFCSSKDNLLYRMVTLNNGQRPMTARHQIEILAAEIFDFESLSISVASEKGRRRATNLNFKKADVIKAYIAFLSDNVNIENQKIIEQKMDELIADRILDSNITEDDLEFEEVIDLMTKFCHENSLLTWFKINNNLIGYCVGIKNSYKFLKGVEPAEMARAVREFEDVFKSSLDVKKINVGQERRKLVSTYISRFEELHDYRGNRLLSAMMSL